MHKRHRRLNHQGQVHQARVQGHQLRGFKKEEVQRIQGHNIDLRRVF